MLPPSLDIEIEVRQLYRRLSIPTAVKEVEEEETSESELGNNEWVGNFPEPGDLSFRILIGPHLLENKHIV